MSNIVDFELPPELIAQTPAEPRDHARLLVYDRRTGDITDSRFDMLLSHLPDPTLVVVNTAKVDHCRMLFDDGKREIFVLDQVNDTTVVAMVRPGKVFRLGAHVRLTPNVDAVVTHVDTDGLRTIVLSEPTDHPDLLAAQHVPLPPYIQQNDSLEHDYQTRYAKDAGSKAAPTAGLHFTDELIERTREQRGWEEITLHVGLGTFAPLTQSMIDKRRLHRENYEISTRSAATITSATHVTAVGTTTVRAIESAYDGQRIRAGRDSTEIFIQPGYEFGRVNAMITNFHLPKTSLLHMVSAFMGSDDELRRVYMHAIEKRYRFYSFGDAMLIL